MYIWNVPDGTFVTQQMMANLYGEANSNIFGFPSYISEGFGIDYSENSLNVTIQPGTASAIYNSNYTSIVTNLSGFFPEARTLDSFNSQPPGNPVNITLPQNSSGYILLNISLTNTQVGIPQYTTQNEIVYSSSLPSNNAPFPDGSGLVGQVVLYSVITNNSSVVYCSSLGPSRDVNLKNYYSSVNNLLTASVITSNPNYPSDGLLIYPTNYFPSYSSIFLANGSISTPGLPYEQPMNSVGSASGSIASLAIVKITDSIRLTYPQFISTGIYLVKSGATLGSAGIFIPDSAPFDLSIPNPFNSPVTTPGCYYIGEYQTNLLDDYVTGIIICSSQASTGYHGLMISYNNSLIDITL